MRKVIVGLMVYLSAGCGSMPKPEYVINKGSDLNAALRSYGDVKVNLAPLTHDEFRPMLCGFNTTLRPKDAVELVSFIGKTFNDELRSAGVYGIGENTVHLTGHVEQLRTSAGSTGILISSPDGNGVWSMALKLKNEKTRKIMKSALQHNFKNRAGGFYNCETTMENFSIAIYMLIENTVVDSDFKELVGIK